MDSPAPAPQPAPDAPAPPREAQRPGRDEELTEAVAARVQQRVESAVDKRVRRHLAEQQMAVARGTAGAGPGVQAGYGTHAGAGSSTAPGASAARLPEETAARIWFGAGSLVLAIPLSAIAAAYAGMAGLCVCWAGIVAVNAVQASRSWFGHGRRAAGDGNDGR